MAKEKISFIELQNLRDKASAFSESFYGEELQNVKISKYLKNHLSKSLIAKRKITIYSELMKILTGGKYDY